MATLLHQPSGRNLDAWDLSRLVAPPEIKPLLGDPPIFRDDEKVLPLQAADFYAWWVLKWHREGSANAGVRDFGFAWEAKKKIKRLHVEYLEEQLRHGVQGIIERADALAALEESTQAGEGQRS